MDNFSSIKEKILHLRKSRKISCELANRPSEASQKALEIFAQQLGFSVKNSLDEIEKNLALKIAKSVLSHDLAYQVKITGEDQALEIIKAFCGLFNKDAKFFTNAIFEEDDQYHLKMKSWNGITEATFDTGIFVIDEKLIGCIWVEDED